jgi:hypothetical protein
MRWEHVDLDGRADEDPPVPASIAVWRSVREHGDTKTDPSRPMLSLPAHAAELLREHRDRQDRERDNATRSFLCSQPMAYLWKRSPGGSSRATRPRVLSPDGHSGRTRPRWPSCAQSWMPPGDRPGPSALTRQSRGPCTP